MQCRKCKKEIPAGGRYCRHCGAVVQSKGSRLDGRWGLFTALFLVLVAGWAAYVFEGILFPFRAPGKGEPAGGESSVTALRQKTPEPFPPARALNPAPSRIVGDLPLRETDTESEPAPAPLPSEQADAPLALPTGTVVVYDAWNNDIATISAVVVEGSWLALPARSCLGGLKWYFYGKGDQMAAIEAGHWQEGVEVGLWRLDGPMAETPVGLAEWREGQTTRWRPLSTPLAGQEVELIPDWRQGNILHVPLPDYMRHPGVFLQDDQVVGWTFGAWLDGGYLWYGGEEIAAPVLSVGDFYQLTYAGGREEQFVRAWTMGDDILPAERLAAFLEGFWREPKLAAEDVPDLLRAGKVMEVVRSLAREMREQGQSAELVLLLDRERLRTLADFPLLTIVVGARIESMGYAGALELIEAVEPAFPEKDDRAGYELLHVKLYRLWLENLLALREVDTAWTVWQRARYFFADDAELHLDGVELALLEGDWTTGQTLLLERDYPEQFLERVASLEERIAGLKGQEGQIAISFPPGSSRIEVKALVNDLRLLPFLVDTGASLVSIPASELGPLGIEIDASTPRRRVVTAAGVKEAWEVRLASVELGGWVVRDMRALVLDNGDEQGYGLLGLNFLRLFEMELHTDEGRLILKPK